MLIDKFTFQTDFLFYKKHTKCTLNLRSLDFPSADSSARKRVINSSRANLSLDLLSFFLQNDSLVSSSTSTFHLCISSVYFTVWRGNLLNLPKFYRASSVSWRAPTGKWQWLTDQSERAIYFCYVIKEFRSDLRTFDAGLQSGQSGLTKEPLAGQGALKRSGHFL